MELLIYLILPILLVLTSITTLLLGRRTPHRASKIRCAKVTTASLGSAVIIWAVYALAPLLQLLVIVLATGWLAKRVATEGPGLGLGWTLRAFKIGRRMLS